MEKFKIKIPAGIGILCLVALFGLKDTGIFVSEHSTTLYSGKKLSFEVSEEAEILEEVEGGYLVKKGEARVTVPKSKIKVVGSQSNTNQGTKVTYKAKDKLIVTNNTTIKSNGKVLRNLFLGETIELIEDRGTYLVVKTSDNLTGAISKTSVKSEKSNNKDNKEIKATYKADKKEDKKTSSGSGVVGKIIDSAYSKMGATYIYGATGNGEYDCSGFVYAIYKNEMGINLPRTSSQQSGFGSQINRSDLKPGDLVFFNTTGSGVSHVGIYIGNDDFIHASSGQSKVIKSSLNEKYYNERYVNATRVY